MHKQEQDKLQEQLTLIESQASAKKGLNLEEKLKEESLKNEKARREARKWFQARLLAFLGFEILFIAYLILSQAIKKLLFTHVGFSLNQWEFAPFINVALIQTCILIRPIAKDLFPGKK
jgi:hypothetical protein